MKPFHQFPRHHKKEISCLLTDLDDTLTHHGRLLSIVFVALERLQRAAVKVILITGRPAGWCDHIARMWPVDGLVGENGAFYFRYDPRRKKMLRRYWKSEQERQGDRIKLETIRRDILEKIPECGIASDQAYREADLAIDYCEDVSPLSKKTVGQIVNCFESAGAQAKISSIHVNGWFGKYNKLAMTRVLFQEVFNTDLDRIKERVIFVGDSPNDCPMFAFFPHSVGVANVRQFEGELDAKPSWVTRQSGGNGFAEMVADLLS